MSDEQIENRSRTVAYKAMATAHPAEFQKRLAAAKIEIGDEEAAVCVLRALSGLRPTVSG